MASAHIISVSAGYVDIGVVLDQTPMYVKRGGQPGDRGLIKGSGFSIEVRDVVYNENGNIVHVGKLIGRQPINDNAVTVAVDAETPSSLAFCR